MSNLRLFPDVTGKLDKIIEAAGAMKFDCFECGAPVEITGSEVVEASEGRKRKKCQYCDEWLSFVLKDGRVYDVKGQTLPEGWD